MVTSFPLTLRSHQVGPIYYKFICSLLARWCTTFPLTLRFNQVGPIHYKLICSLPARWCTSDKWTGRDHKIISTIHCIVCFNQSIISLKKAFEEKLPKEVIIRLFENQSEITDLGISSTSVVEEMAKDIREKSNVVCKFYESAEDVLDPRELS